MFGFKAEINDFLEKKFQRKGDMKMLKKIYGLWGNHVTSQSHKYLYIVKLFSFLAPYGIP